jgi:hypothetical protein
MARVSYKVEIDKRRGNERTKMSAVDFWTIPFVASSVFPPVLRLFPP